MDTGDDRQDKNKQEPFFGYSSEDRELLISMLKEYSSRLIYISEEMENNQKIENSVELTFLILTALFFVFGVISGTIDNIIDWLSEEAKTLGGWGSLASIVSFLIPVIVYIFRWLGNLYSRIRQLKNKGRGIALRLERLVRTTSQVEEHFEKNLARKIELDFILADAESALDEYRKISRQSQSLMTNVLAFFIKRYR